MNRIYIIAIYYVYIIAINYVYIIMDPWSTAFCEFSIFTYSA